MGAIAPGTIEGALILGMLWIVAGGIVVGIVDAGSRAWAAACVIGGAASLLIWLLLFRLLFGVAA